ncbi:MAG: DUF4180 domain-containing protein [Anaerolineales bacterium]
MSYTIIQKNDKNYLECQPGMMLIESEQDALDLVALCGENETQWLMLHSENLSPDFFDLKSGLAGKILLKFAVYQIKAVLIATPGLVGDGRFAEMAMESNRFNQFGVFYGKAEAEQWLLRD